MWKLPSPRVRTRVRLFRRCLAVVASVAIAVLIASLIVGRVERFEFPFQRIEQAADRAAVMELSSQFHIIQNWRPRSASPEIVEVLSDAIALPENTSVTTFLGLCRTERDAFGSLNATVQLLTSEQSEESDLNSLRRMSREVRVERVHQLVEQAVQSRRLEAIDRLLRERHTAQLLTKLECPAWPEPPSRWRKLACRWTGAVADGRSVWMSEFLRGAEQQVRPTAIWTTRWLRSTELADHADAASAVVWQPLPGTAALDWEHRRTTCDFRVLIRVKELVGAERTDQSAIGQSGSNDARLTIDTGLRLFGVEVVTSNGHMPSNESEAAQPPRLNSESGSVAVDLTLFQNFLRTTGLSDELTVHQAEASRVGEKSTTEKSSVRSVSPPRLLSGLEVKFTLRHRDVPVYSGKHSLSFATQPDRAERLGEVIQFQTLPELRAAFRKQSKYRDFPVEVASHGPASSESESALRVRFKPKNLKDGLDLPVSLGDDGRLAWGHLPTAAQRQSVVELLTNREPLLKPVAGLLSVSRAAPVGNPATIDGTVELALDDSTDRKVPALSWSLTSAGKITLHVRPEEVQAFVKHAEPMLASAPAVTTNKTDVETLVREHLRSSYAILAGLVRPQTVASPAGVGLKLSLQFGDWPEIELGPKLIQSREQVAELVNRMLSPESISAALSRDWTSRLTHPRFGMLTVKFETWDAVQGKLGLKVAPDLPTIGEQLSWSHPVWVENGGWREQAESQIIEWLDERAQSVETTLNDFLDKTANIDLRLEADRSRFGNQKWFRLSPPMVALRGRVKLPWLPLRVSASGVTLDRTGFHWPSEARVTLMMTVPIGAPAAPFCSLSDPSITLRPSPGSAERVLAGEMNALADWEVHVGGKITPPMIPLQLIFPEADGLDLEQLSSEQHGMMVRAYGLAPDLLPLPNRIHWYLHNSLNTVSITGWNRDTAEGSAVGHTLSRTCAATL